MLLILKFSFWESFVYLLSIVLIPLKGKLFKGWGLYTHLKIEFSVSSYISLYIIELFQWSTKRTFPLSKLSLSILKLSFYRKILIVPGLYTVPISISIFNWPWGGYPLLLLSSKMSSVNYNYISYVCNFDCNAFFF